jgi:chromosome segregation protein
MYLKNLTVLGFKSFPDKTSLNFQPGVTAIVGPNGCGKSNVSDAIRWVLGEQSAKALRGSEMADVIFTGTDNRRPLGMAEVSLTLGGVDEEHLSAAGVEMDYSEVTVTRRVFRDGGSEYFINRTPCRLKDIQQFFMGTGVGRSSYSIMAQGHITQILSSKPEERRMIFEEAAGITKYKSQKREALRKLEYTDQNLLRVADLVREVKRQLISLQRQAGKAKRYQQLMQQMQHLDTQLARHQYDLLQAEIHERQGAADTLRAELDACSGSVLGHEEELGKRRAQLSELERHIAQAQQRGLELKAEIERHSSRIQFNEERLRELASQDEKAMGDITQAEERRHAADQELASASERCRASEAARQQHQQTLEERQATLARVEGELKQRQDSLRAAQEQAFETAQVLTRIRNEVTVLDFQKQNDLGRLEKLSTEKLQLEEERTRLEARLAEFTANVATERLNAKTKRGSLGERQQRLREVQAELEQCARALDHLTDVQAAKHSRLALLEQLHAEREGYTAGSLAALKQTQSVLGSLADKIRVPDQYVTAIETALGHHLQLVLTEEPEAAQRILADLNVHKQGRASIAPLAWIRNNGHGKAGAEPDRTAPQHSVEPRTAPPELNGAPVPAVLVVEAEDSVRPLVERLLGATQIVQDLAAATKAWSETSGTFHYVTLTGEFLSRHGVFTGGSPNGNGNGSTPASLLGRKNQIADLRAALESLEKQATELSGQRNRLQTEQTDLQAGVQQMEAELHEHEVSIATREGEFNALQNSQRLLHQKIDTVVYEIQSVAAQEKEGDEKRAGLASQAAEAETAESAQQAIVAELTTALESLRQEREAAQALASDSKVALAAEEQVCASFRQQCQALEQRIQELQQLVEQRHTEMAAFVTRRDQARVEIGESRQQIAVLQEQHAQVLGQTNELVGQKQSCEAEITTRDETLREQRRRMTELQEKRGALEVELAQKNMAVQNLTERIQQKYQVNLEAVRSECITITIAVEGPAKVHVLTPEEMAANGAATDWNAVAEQVTALQKRLEEMGPVNLVAIVEYDETDQRYQFLSKQHDDLVSAKAQLLEVVSRINVQTRQMFGETFDKIRQNFRVMFTEVFGGGKADLYLVDENVVLESGIEIVARPPGKQLQTISLLSGGEQTMTAVALLFSIYQVRPSPFCVLDELDAPLDESNINRFVRILQRFLAHSQFIIITHNKRTIGMADVLYGVTMEEQGVSKIVSVKFHKTREGVTMPRLAPLVPPSSGPPLEDEEDAPLNRDEALEVVMAK